MLHYSYVPFGNMWEHVREYWKRRHESNILFLKYEDMKKNHTGSVKMICDFLGKNYADEELQGLVDHTCFSEMREYPNLNLEHVNEKHKSGPDVKFIRKGQVGDWQNHMSKEMADKFDEMSQKCELDYEYRKKLEKFFGIGNYLIEVNPGKLIVPRIFHELAERMLSLEVRPDDVWLVSYLRTGSNWTREILWCLINDLDYEGAKLRIEGRAPLLELTGLVGGDYNRELAYTKNHLFNNSVDRVEHMSSPRLIKTHLPWQLIPTRINITKSKIIYIARNPKDCCVSFYYYSLQFYNAQGTFEDFCKLFLLGKMFYGNMWEHARHFWKHRHESNILFLKYEDMKKNHLGCVKMISDFLGKNYSDEELRGLVEHTSFSEMRQNPALNRDDFVNEIYKSGEGRTDVKFIRKGHVGDWQNHMSKEMADQFDEMSQKWWSDIGLTFEDRI